MLQSLKRLWPYIRPFKRDLFLMFVSGFLVTMAAGLVPVLGQTLIELFKGGELETVKSLSSKVLPYVGLSHLQPLFDNREWVAKWIPYFFPLMFLTLGLLRFSHHFLVNYTSERVIANLRQAMVRKILRLNLTYLGSLERGSGSLISRVFNDPVVLQIGLNFYVELLREPVQALIYLSFLFWLDWKLTLFALIFLPFFIFVTKRVSRSLRKYGTIGREAMEDLTAVFKDAIDGARVVQSFNLENEMQGRFKAKLDKYVSTARAIHLRENAASPINEFLISFLLFAFAMYAINEVLAGADGARFLGFILAAGLLQAPIKKLQDAGVKIQQSLVVSQRIFELLDHPSEVPEIKNPRPFPANWKTITFRNVSFSYGNEMVLKNVNLTVNRGEIVALVGESGSGKSTMVNLLERFYDPTSGEILVDNTPINEISLRELRKNIALVTQDVFLFRDTIARNIHAGDFEKNPSTLEESAKLANAHSFITSTKNGYQSPVGERGSFLSGGEKQRVSIARAIFKNAPILILDEATSALDSVSELEVQKGLTHLLENRTAFVIAHRLSTVFNADRILVMKKGEIIEQGSHQNLLEKQGEYHRFFRLQMDHQQRAQET